MELNVKTRLDSLEKKTQAIILPATQAKHGTALVQNSQINGYGCFCDIQELCQGQPTGVKYYRAQSHSAQFRQGDVVSWSQRADGCVEIVGGGGGGGTSSTSVISGAFVVYLGVVPPGS